MEKKESNSEKIERLKAELAETEQLKQKEEVERQKAESEQKERDHQAWLKTVSTDEKAYLKLIDKFNSIHRDIINMLANEGRKKFNELEKAINEIAEAFDNHEKLSKEKQENPTFEKSNLFHFLYGGWEGFLDRAVQQLKKGYIVNGEKFSVFR